MDLTEESAQRSTKQDIQKVRGETDRARELKPLEVRNMVQVQNQTWKDALRWSRSSTMVESLGNQQYSVKMDSLARVTLRNIRFLRKIKPLSDYW